MMTKVEGVAKAIAARDLDEGDGFYDWFALTEEVTDKYLAMARAAIDAMREPTEAMVNAGYDVGYSPDPLPTDEVWRAMIDAALSHEGK